ncbi:S-layer homology domain-containing protein [Geosporobacter ferrireducens]|uniref:SLH domain-containing protein n=1 Tax=Geosporobacter ferrireducens TaxID=1424294 RepID=A0A1D8GH31_9FIRM|nr:S-layer homology domain-containing protein [Geosporobacter ferrireducens]AOT70190.1 hypothetical protein Gferi_11645 [Geosporobacter ferrireducens]MTI53263.1 hypothetical protein [Geosporobacter ferrireducens]
MTAKRILAMLIVLILVLGTIAPAFAEEKNNGQPEMNAGISKDEAKAAAEKVLTEYFKQEIDDKKFQSRYELRKDYDLPGNPIWEIYWDYSGGDRGLHIRAVVDGTTGKVLDINRHEYLFGQEQPAVAAITEEEAKKIAVDFLQKINPKEFKEVKEVEDSMNMYYGGYYPRNYYFRYVRMVNDIEFERNYINVEVDGIKGSISSYSCRWYDALNVPSKQGVIGEEKAAEILAKNVKMELSYLPQRKDPNFYDQKVERAKLVYAPSYMNGYVVDAKEGVMLNWRGQSTIQEKIKDITQKQKEDILKGAKPVVKQEKEIDKDRAAKIMEEILKQAMGEGYEIESMRYLSGENYWETSGNKAWSGQFVKKDSARRYDEGGTITINALTEELIAMYSHYWYGPETEAFEPKLDWEAAYDKAIEAVGTYFPEKIKNIKTEQTYIKNDHYVNGKLVQEQYYYFYFPRLINGIPYSQDNISVSVDVKTGQMREIRSSWNEDLIFQTAQGAIGSDAALKMYLENHEPQLIYTMFDMSENPENPNLQTKLVYRLKAKNTAYPFVQMDAFTGKFVDYNGEEIKENGSEFKDKIKGHWAEKELSVLASQGIIDAKTFDPDKKITRMEAIKMLISARGRVYMTQEAEDLKFTNISKSDTNYRELQMAVRYGLLENKTVEFDGEAVITREEMAVLLVRLMQMENLAKIKDIYILPFKDADKVSPDKIGYIALCKGLELVGGSDGLFRPQEEATMAELAAAVYKGLNSIRNLRY